MKDDSSKFVGRGCDRLGPAEFAGDAAGEFTQTVLRVVERLSAHAQGRRYPASYASAFGEQPLATTNLLLRRESPSQDANAEAFRNRETSVPISHKIV